MKQINSKIKSSERLPIIERNLFLQNIIAYQTDFIHFEQILNKLISKINDIIIYLKKDQENKTSVFLEDYKEMEFYQEFSKFQQTVSKIEYNEVEYYISIKQEILPQLSVS